MAGWPAPGWPAAELGRLAVVPVASAAVPGWLAVAPGWPAGALGWPAGELGWLAVVLEASAGAAAERAPEGPVSAGDRAGAFGRLRREAGVVFREPGVVA